MVLHHFAVNGEHFLHTVSLPYSTRFGGAEKITGFGKLLRISIKPTQFQLPTMSIVFNLSLTELTVRLESTCNVLEVTNMIDIDIVLFEKEKIMKGKIKENDLATRGHLNENYCSGPGRSFGRSFSERTSLRLPSVIHPPSHPHLHFINNNPP